MGQRRVCTQMGRFVATELARGPWDPGALHGGAPAALLMRAFEQLPAADGLVIARVTYEFVRPAPVGALFVRLRWSRPGRRVKLLEASLADPDGDRGRRARARCGSCAEPDRRRRVRAAPAGPRPRHGEPATSTHPRRPMFAPDAIEIRFISGALRTAGPGDGVVSPAPPPSPARSPHRCSGWRRPATSATGSAAQADVARPPVHQPRPDAVLDRAPRVSGSVSSPRRRSPAPAASGSPRACS